MSVSASFICHYGIRIYNYQAKLLKHVNITEHLKGNYVDYYNLISTMVLPLSIARI